MPVIDNVWLAPPGPRPTTAPLGPGSTVRIVTNDFMFGGGDGYTALSGGTDVLQTGDLLLDVMIDYIKANSPITTLPVAGPHGPVRSANLPPGAMARHHCAMAPRLLEREAPLGALIDALAAAEAGHGSTALVIGEPGIGKTSLVRAFAAEAATRARLLSAACDDLVTPRTLGPLHDAAVGTDGPLAQALSGDGQVFTALMEELAEQRPTVLLIEDAHWADDATVDVLGYAARRVESLGALLVVTLRDEALVPGHPLHRLLGVVAGQPVHRLELTPLSREAVVALAEGTGRDGAAIHELTAGNPFFVAEALAAPPDEVPASVKDAVLARLRHVSPECLDALERLSVVPSTVPGELAEALLGDGLVTLAEAEQAALIEARPGGIGFRHELARRAIEDSLPGIRRRLLNQDVDARAARRRAARARPPAAPRGRGGRHRDAARGGPGGGARSGPRRLTPPVARALRGRDGALPAGWSRASARRCSTTTAGSSTTRTGSATRSTPAATPCGCTRSSRTGSRSRTASCGSPATCS